MGLAGICGAILGIRGGLSGGDLVGIPLDLRRSTEGERVSLVGSGMWNKTVEVQCGLDFATFEQSEHKVVLLLLCWPASVALVCVEAVLALQLEVGFLTSLSEFLEWPLVWKL